MCGCVLPFESTQIADVEVIVMDDSPRAEEASQFPQELDIRWSS